jgi:hypothetical protein
MKRFAFLAAAAALACLSVPDGAFAQSVGASVRNPYAAAQPSSSLRGGAGLLGASSIRDPNSGSLAPKWLDGTSITDPKAGTVTPEGFEKYGSLTSAIKAEPVQTAPNGPLAYSLPPTTAPVPTSYDSYGTPFRPYQAPTNAFNTPYTVYTLPSLQAAPAGYGSARVPSSVSPADEAAAEIATGSYLERENSGGSRRMGTNR